LHTEFEHYFYLPDSALIYDFIVKNAELRRTKDYEDDKDVDVNVVESEAHGKSIEMQTWPVVAFRCPRRWVFWCSGVDPKPPLFVCTIAFGHNSKLELCCPPIARASRVFIWRLSFSQGRLVPSARGNCHVTGSCRRRHWLI